MRIYHPAYESKRDRVTRIAFAPVELDGKKVATADVDDPEAIESLLARGFLPWPGPEGARPPSSTLPTAEELDAMTVAELRAAASSLELEVPAKATKAELRALFVTPY